MRVFVTGTGRCGSVSFREACRYITNYGNGHESKCGLLEYPDNWIEVNPQLRNVIPHLVEKYPDAKWVHLIREPEPCIRSLANLDDGTVMEAYRLLHDTVIPSNQASDVAWRYYWSENDDISALLKALVPSERRLVIVLESVQDQWKCFWDWIGAEGDFELSKAAWSVKRNTTEERRGV